MLARVAVLLIVSGWLMAQAPSGSERRVALVIGNSAYRSGRVLKNPGNDARALAQRLSELNFDVLLKLDANQQEMDEAIRYFTERLGPGAAGIFFFAGHGIQVDSTNYLLPIDFDRRGTDEQSVKYSSVPADDILERMEKSKSRLSLLILDACRDNPFITRRSRSSAGGLAEMKAAQGTAVMFATDAGKTADDNPNDQNGIFTKHLLETLQEPGLSVGEIQEVVADKVMKATNNTQNPAYTTKIAGRFIINPGARTTNAPSAVPTTEAPVITELKADSLEIDSTQSVNLRVAATDPNADPLTYSWSVSGGRIESSGTSAVFTPDRGLAPGQSAAAKVTVAARNSRGVESRRDLLIRINAPAPPAPGTLVGSVRSLGAFLDVQLESRSPGPAAPSGTVEIRLERVERVWQIIRVDGALPGTQVQLAAATPNCGNCPLKVAEYPNSGNTFLRTRLQVRPDNSMKAFTISLSWQAQQSKKKGK